MKLNLKLNQNLRTPKGNLLEGTIIELECDTNSIPLNRFWRNRLRDSAIDNCVGVINKNKKNK